MKFFFRPRCIKECKGKSMGYLGACLVTIQLFACLSGGVVAQVPQERGWKLAGQQSSLMIDELDRVIRTDRQLVAPRTLSETGELIAVRSTDWTSGFFAGSLWFLYEHTRDEKWLRQAKKATAPIEQEQFNGRTHDMGFKIYCSVGNGYRLTADPAYREVIVQSAKTLAGRFNPTVGCIRSWDHNQDKWDFPVIIDNMLNLELLFAATKLTGDSSFYDIAVSHADLTMKNHFREDYSTFHVIDYNPETGEVRKQNTHQGYSHGSTWARGQAWALYGYTMCYRETGDKRYLQQAEYIARWLFNHPHMPTDLVPYWDFDAPDIPHEPRDVSAATVIASALIELSQYSDEGIDYLRRADLILEAVLTRYASAAGANRGFILLHSTGSKPSLTEVDKPLSYADYYFLEALLRREKTEKKGNTEADKIAINSTR